MKNKNLAYLLKSLMAVTALTSVLVACGSKNNDNNQNLNAYTASCVNCDGITGYPFFTADTSAYYYNASTRYTNTPTMKINWSFSGQNISGQAQGQSSYNPYASPAMQYVGKVSAAGTINLATPVNFGFCPQFPAGTYNLTTQTVGQWNAGQISGLKILISGAVSATAYVQQAQAYENTGYSGYNGYNGYNPYNQYNNGLGSTSGSRITGGYLVIEQVNGYYCQGAQLALY
jgi:hypothetical protein